MQSEIAKRKEQLKTVRPVAEVTLTTRPTTQQDAEAEKEIIAKHFAVNMDRWVENLQQHNKTIRTLSLPLTPHQGQALLAKNHTSKQSPTADDEKQFELIKQQLQVLIDQVDGSNQGCFVKLSCRSAKDVTLAGDRFNRELDRIRQEEQHLLDGLTDKYLRSNLMMQWLYRAHTQALRVYSAQEALDLLLQSRRIFWDLTYDLTNPDTFSTHLIVREWLHIPMESEFRVFVKQKGITGISQYFTQMYFPSLVENQERIEKELIEFWSGVSKLLPEELEDYVIDFAWSLNEDGSRHWLVLELNPFNMSTGAGLFSWESESDSDLLEGKTGSRDFRLQQSPTAHQQINKVHPTWVQHLSET